MIDIHFINNISFVNGLACNSSPRKVTMPFLRQGDLDGACAVYSLMMMLILQKKVTPDQLRRRDKTRGYTAIMRLQDQFLYGIIGLYRGGYFFHDLAAELRHSFSKLASATTYCSHDKERNDYISKKDLHKTIKEAIDAGVPVEIGYSYRQSGGHAVVAIGYAIRDNIMQLFCLDPGFELANTSLWNTVIEIDLEYKKRSIYTDLCHTIKDELPQSISVDEILLID